MVSQRVGDLPDYEPRADLLSYTLSWDDVVTFSLTTAQIDPAQIEDVWIAFDVDEQADGPPPQDKSPTFVVFSASGGDGLYELRDMYTFVCPVRRSIVAGSFVRRAIHGPSSATLTADVTHDDTDMTQRCQIIDP